jgi:hypothetical protein
MISRSLKQAIADAEKEAPAGATFEAWESGEYEIVIVEANRTDAFNTDRVSFKAERLDNNQRRMFDFAFPDVNEDGISEESRKKRLSALSQTGRKLTALGLDPVLDVLGEQYPIEEGKSEAENTAAWHAQLEGLAAALAGVKFLAKITKQEKQNKKGQYLNWIDIVRLIDGPVVPNKSGGSTGGLSGLVG